MRLFASLVVALAAAAAAGAAPAPPPLTETCGTAYARLHARTRWLQTADRVHLYAADAGAGRTALVLAHGANSDLCETLDFALQAVRAGYRVVAFDFRGFGRSDAPARNALARGRDLAAAVAHARRLGARHVFLIGSSMGGATVVQNSASLRVDGRISLSGTRLWPGFGVNHPRAVARIRAPFLYVGSRADGRAPLPEARAVFRRVGAKDKRIVLYPGPDHGWNLIETAPFAKRARALVLRWLAARG